MKMQRQSFNTTQQRRTCSTQLMPKEIHAQHNSQSTQQNTCRRKFMLNMKMQRQSFNATQQQRRTCSKQLMPKEIHAQHNSQSTQQTNNKTTTDRRHLKLPFPWKTLPSQNVLSSKPLSKHRQTTENTSDKQQRTRLTNNDKQQRMATCKSLTTRTGGTHPSSAPCHIIIGPHHTKHQIINWI